MQKLWTGDVVDHEGEFYRLRGVRMQPAVGGPIPILCSGESDAALRRAARIGTGWIPPISVSSPELLVSRLEQIAEYRREARREGGEFAVYWTPRDRYDPRDQAELMRIGVSHVFASPWPFDAAEALGVEEKCALIEEFGHRVIEKSE
jgi:hypothetical protein